MAAPMNAKTLLVLKNGRWKICETFVEEPGEAGARKATRDFYID